MANVERRAHVVWEGDLASGSGRLIQESSKVIRGRRNLRLPRGAPGREDEPGGADSLRHATCYAMALSNTLAEKDAPPVRLEVNAVCTLDDEQLKITTMNLDVRGEVPCINDKEFERAAREADETCPVTNALRGNVENRLQTRLDR
jgi:osmotically inducible protein OsmC